MTLALRRAIAVLFAVGLSPIAIGAALYLWVCEGGSIVAALADSFASVTPWPAKVRP